jgi:IS5 family transposase
MAAINATLAAKRLILKIGTEVDATLIAALGSTKNSAGEGDPEMHATKKGNQWQLGMKTRAGVDAGSAIYQGTLQRPGRGHSATGYSVYLG